MLAPLIPTRKVASFCSCYKWLILHEFYVLNILLCSIVFGAKQASRTNWKSEISFSWGIYPVCTGYLLPFNWDKSHWVIPQISFHATDTYRDIPCTNNPVWVIQWPCLSQVSSDGPKDIPGITLWSAYTTLYIPDVNTTSKVIQQVSDFRCRSSLRLS